MMAIHCVVGKDVVHHEISIPFHDIPLMKGKTMGKTTRNAITAPKKTISLVNGRADDKELIPIMWSMRYTENTAAIVHETPFKVFIMRSILHACFIRISKRSQADS